MNFQGLPPIEEFQFYLDKAFSRAKKRTDAMGSSQGKKTDPILFRKKLAHEKITIVRDQLSKDFRRIIDSYPNFDGLPEFYDQLVNTQVDIDNVKLSLGRVQGALHQIEDLATKSQNEIRKIETTATTITNIVQQYYGRVSALLKKVSKPLQIIENTRKILVTFPNLKEEHFTVALAGFPNVGKSTLLSKITPSKPKIANYAFTTKTLNVGYYTTGYHQIQIVDTPGTLSRFEKMNKIEQQAYLCLRYAADFIVFILDPTETYPLDTQLVLLEELKEHDKPLCIFISKTDIADKKVVATLQKKYDALTDTKILQELILEKEKNYF